MVEHNWDTNETILWAANDEDYLNILKPWLENEIIFIDQLFGIILHINERVNREHKIDLTKVNGNEVFIKINELFGNETEGWK